MAGGKSGARPTITDVRDPVKLEQAIRLLFDNVEETRALIRALGSKDPGDPAAPDTTPQGGPANPRGGGGGGFAGGPRGPMQPSTERSSQGFSGQMAQPQAARVPRLPPGAYSFEDSPVDRGYAVTVDPGRLTTGFDGELRIDVNEQIDVTGTASTWPDYNGKTWRFDDRDNIWKPLQALGCILMGDVADFDAADYARGTILRDSTTKIVYYCDYSGFLPQATQVWRYMSGMQRGLLSALPAPSIHQSGYLYFATDYEHLYYWNGVNWQFGPGDDGSSYIGWYIDQPNYGSWQLCDGTSVNVAQSDGSLSNVSTPDFASFAISFDDQDGVTRTFTGVYPKASSAYSGAVEGPYYKTEPLTAGAVEAISGTSPYLFPAYLALLAYLRR